MHQRCCLCGMTWSGTTLLTSSPFSIGIELMIRRAPGPRDMPALNAAHVHRRHLQRCRNCVMPIRQIIAGNKVPNVMSLSAQNIGKPGKELISAGSDNTSASSFRDMGSRVVP